ncbi:hypothetical protein P3S68_022064 [Capsicum galapagoense]
MDFLCMNLNDATKYLDKPDPLFRRRKDGDDTSNIEGKPPYLLCLVMLVELEMNYIFLGDLKASKPTQSITFMDMRLPPEFSHHLIKQKLKNSHSDVSAQVIDAAIEFLLVFLGDAPCHVIHGTMLNEVMEKAGSLVGDILCAIQKLFPSTIIKDDASEINLCSIQIFEKAENLKALLEEYYKSLTFIPSQFPTVGGLSFLDSLLRKLNEISKSERGLGFMMKPHIVLLERELSSLTSIFKDVVKVHHEDEILKDLQRRTINLAYEAEVAIDCILSRYNALLHLFCSLPTILKEIKNISVEVKEKWSDNLALKPCSMVEPSKRQPIQHSDLMYDEEIVGFHNDMKRIIQHLIQGANELDVVPIVGMGGQGKTTCARKVYNSDAIVSHFDVRAWCIISQTYNRRELLQEIFSQVTGSKDKGDKDDILADELRKSLMKKRYLIVLDDMWNCMTWDNLRLCFPDGGNRSRILVTTQLEKVGEHVKRHTDLYFLPFLTPDESSKLLQKKVFQREDCPPELHDVSQEVAKRCKGLPLVIILVAGIIKRKKMEASWWHEVKNSLLSYLGESEGYGLSTMKLSYDNLPDHLRPTSEWNLMRLLKVLELSSLDVNYFSLATLKPLIHLKYLAVSTREVDFHADPYLPNLETLIVKYFIRRSVLPAIFWKFEKLRHVEINNAVFDLENNKQMIFEESSKLENLRVLRKVYFQTDQSDSVDVLLRRCPNLQELDISIGSNENSAEFCPKLELLKTASALEESFPKLETLVIKGCYKLEEIPLSFADIPTLKQIKLINCNNKSLEASAVKIKEEVADIEGCDRIDFTIGDSGKI